MLTLNSAKVLQGKENFSMLGGFSYKLAQWNLMGKPSATKEVRWSEMTCIKKNFF